MVLFRFLKFVGCMLPIVAGIPASARTFSVMVYNVENLFDDDGVAAYDDYQPALYTSAHFKTKLANISRVVGSMENGRGPDIILFQEIEVDQTPDRIAPAEQQLRASFEAAGMTGYTVVAGGDSAGKRYQDGNPRAVKCVIFTRFPVKAVRNHPTLNARNILEVELEIEGARLYVFDNHWKSGAGDPVTEKIRIANAHTLRSRLDEILRDDPHADIILGGDFNSQYNQDRVMKGRMPITALNDVLHSQGNELAVRGSKADLYNLWFELTPGLRGSDVYRGEWGTLIQLIISRGLYDFKGVQYVDNSFTVLRLKGLNATPEGTPLRWTSEGAAGSGFSDHFPVYALFRTVKDNRAEKWLDLEKPSTSNDSPPRPLKAPEKTYDVATAVNLASVADQSSLRSGSFNGKLMHVEGRVGKGHRLSVEARGSTWDVWVPDPALRERIRSRWHEGESVSFYGILGQFKGVWQFTVERADWIR
ncbi:MAG: endonuclease/exonuclease/phosphatase family protein [Opitutaceae bacterium]|nr:endonuclease/exonuclease/phosphatase family protein [Opitutaceae bacterium]